MLIEWQIRQISLQMNCNSCADGSDVADGFNEPCFPVRLKQFLHSGLHYTDRHTCSVSRTTRITTHEHSTGLKSDSDVTFTMDTMLTLT